MKNSEWLSVTGFTESVSSIQARTGFEMGRCLDSQTRSQTESGRIETRDSTGRPGGRAAGKQSKE